MSVTTVLVPVLEPEIEGLFEGGAAREDAQNAIVARASVLRPRVSWVDSVREDLHALLFPLFEESSGKPPGLLQRLKSRFLPNPAIAPSTGYDPFVQLFGRSLPVGGSSPLEVAQVLQRVMGMEEERFRSALTSDLAALDPRTRDVLANARVDASSPREIAEAVNQQVRDIDRALRSSTPAVREVLDAAVRLSAWSWPVWRFDGEMLPDLLAKLNTTVKPQRASGLFDPLVDERPELAELLETLPKMLAGFDGAGSFLPSGSVKILARSLKLYARKVAENVARTGESPVILMRNLRLLEEALLFCEAEGLALCEASGVEWHDRPRA